MDSGWRRLAEQIRSDAPSRFDTAAQLARAAGLSPRTIEDLTAGRRTRYRETTLYAVESALGWEHGAAQRIVEGGSVRRQDDAGLARITDAWPRLTEQSRRVLLAVLDVLSQP